MGVALPEVASPDSSRLKRASTSFKGDGDEKPRSSVCCKKGGWGEEIEHDRASTMGTCASTIYKGPKTAWRS